LGGCADTKPPKEFPAGDLRIIPEVSAVGTAGGPVFLQVELSKMPEGEYAVYLESYEATLASLPGVPTCNDVTGDGAAGAGGTKKGIQVLPKAAFECRKVGEREICRAGAVAQIPAGDTDVLVVGTLSSVNNHCEPTKGLAIVSARIGRADTGSADPIASGGASSSDDSGGAPGDE